MAVKKPTTRNKRVYQDIDLRDALGFSLHGRDALKEALGQALIDRIAERAQDGKGVKYSAGATREVTLRKPYSKEYQSSDEFKAAGKSASNVNMTLTGDMIGLMDIVKIKGNTIRIGWHDEDEELKAHGHMTGQQGSNKKMFRPFFGVTNKDLRELKKQFGVQLKQIISAEPSIREQRISALIEQVRGEPVEIDVVDNNEDDDGE